MNKIMDLVDDLAKEGIDFGYSNAIMLKYSNLEAEVNRVEAELVQRNDVLKMLAQRARSFPHYPIGFHIPEVFAAIGETPPAPGAKAMTSRERFEAWAGNPLMMGMRGDKYHNDHVQIRWEAWQAAERDMLERAIAAAETRKIATGGVHNLAVDRVIDKLKELLK